MVWTRCLPVLLLLAINVELIGASFCGESAIPFSFELLPNSQPVLGCARPSCFGWTANGEPATAAATFYRVNHRPDGYFRKTVNTTKPHYPNEWASFKPQTAVCEKTYGSANCSRDTQWVGGLSPLTNTSNSPLELQCCEYSLLRESTDRGVAVVNPGQIVFGGEVLDGQRQYAFDYISDVVKHSNGDNRFDLFNYSLNHLVLIMMYQLEE